MLALGGECLDGGVGKLLPAAPLVRGGLPAPYGECCVEQENTLLSPAAKVTACGRGDAKVGRQLLHNVLQRGGHRHTVVDGKAETVGLTGLMIRVLTDDHHFHFLEWAEVEGVEDERARRIARAVTVFLAHKLGELPEIRLFKLARQLLFPAFLYFYVHAIVPIRKEKEPLPCALAGHLQRSGSRLVLC